MPATPDRPLRRRIEDGFERWGYGVARHAGFVTTVVALLTLGIGPYALRIRFEAHPEKFLPAEHPARLGYEDFRREFGLDNTIVLALRVPDVFELGFLTQLRALHQDLEARVPYLDEVQSLLNARTMRGEGAQLVVGELFEPWPETDADLARIESIARAHPIHRGLLISQDATLTTVNLQLTPWSTMETAEALAALDDVPGSEEAEGPTLLSGTEMEKAVGVVREVLAAHPMPGAEVYLAGDPVMAQRLSEDTTRNLEVFLSLSLVAIVGWLAVLFRRVAGVVLPILVVVLALIATAGIAGLHGRSLTIAAQLLPTFLLCVGIATSLHLLVAFFQRHDRGMDRASAIAGALQHTGLPTALTSVTTAAGLLSFNAANLEIVRDIGVFAPIGVLLILAYCLVLLPALLAISPIRRRRVTSHGPRPWVRALLAASDFGVRRPRLVVGAALALTAVALVGLRWLTYEHDPLTWFPEDDPVRTSTRVIDQELGGTLSLEVVIDTGRENGLHEPELQRALDQLAGEVSALQGDHGIQVRKTLSVADITQEIHQALHEGRPEYHAIPEDRTLLAQELLLFEGSGTDDLEEWVDSTFRRARFSARVIWVATQHYLDFVPRVQGLFEEALGSEVPVVVTGILPLITTALEEVRWAMISSYLWSLAQITPLMMLMIGSIRGGLQSMVPNLAPILWVLGWMGWVGLGLDSFTILVGSIALGIAVDDTVHFLHGFYREMDETNDVRESIRRTLESTGEAMVITTVVLCSGFLVYSFATLSNLSIFGQLSALTLGLALLAEVVVTPALLVLATRSRVLRALAPADADGLERPSRVHPRG